MLHVTLENDETHVEDALALLCMPRGIYRPAWQVLCDFCSILGSF
jgi:hypothetical protein